jgi:hypothetical protein
MKLFFPMIIFLLIFQCLNAKSDTCLPPASGTWEITESCIFKGRANVSEDIWLSNNSVLTIDANAKLRVDLNNQKIIVKQGSGILIKEGGKLYQTPPKSSKEITYALNSETYSFHSVKTGDLNGDGLEDLVIGSYLIENSDMGRIDIIFGRVVWPENINFEEIVDASFVSADAESIHVFYNVGGDVNKDGFDDLLIVMKGKTFLALGKKTGWQKNTLIETAANAVFLGEQDGNLSRWFPSSILGDINGDGIDDFMLGYPTFDNNKGKVYLFLGRKSADWGELSVTEASASFYNNKQYVNGLGTQIIAGGDINNDGFDDALILSRTRLHILYGKAEKFGKNVVFPQDDLSVTFSTYVRGNHTIGGFHYSSSISSGDVNGDNFSDILVGDCQKYIYENPLKLSGYAFLLQAPFELGVIDPLMEAQGVWIGNTQNQYVGMSISIGGDYNGDGFNDILIYEFNRTDSSSPIGKFYLYLGKNEHFGRYNLAGEYPDIKWTSEDLPGHALLYSSSAIVLSPDINDDDLGDIVILGKNTIHLLFGKSVESNFIDKLTIDVYCSNLPSDYFFNPAVNYYSAGEQVDIIVHFNKLVIVEGTPELLLNSRGGAKAEYVNGSGTNELLFRYTVAEGDNTINFDYADSNSLKGVIRDIFGEILDLELPQPQAPGSISEDQDIVVKTSTSSDSNFPNPATNLTWHEEDFTSSSYMTAKWIKSSSPNLASQNIQLYLGENCNEAISFEFREAPHTVSSYYFAATKNGFFTYKVISKNSVGGSSISECSSPLEVSVSPELVLIAQGIGCSQCPAGILENCNGSTDCCKLYSNQKVRYRPSSYNQSTTWIVQTKWSQLYTIKNEVQCSSETSDYEWQIFWDQ